MKIYFPFDFQENPQVFMRRAGYGMFNDPNTGITSYTKRLDRDYYPRFHVYIETDKENKTSINLHLDQKKASYQGSHAHNAEYEGGRVDEEGRRLEGLIKNQKDNQEYIESQKEEKKKGIFSAFFGRN